jgi:hypothetical protein
MVYTVTYVANEYTLTINYVFSDNGSIVQEPYVTTLKHGESYSVESPSVGGYQCLEPTVSGTIDISDVTVTVYYYRKAPDINVTVEWGNMSFDFSQDEWDPDIHDYPGDTYTPSVPNESNKIKVTNKSTIAIVAYFDFVPASGYESIVGHFTDSAIGGNEMSSINLGKNASDEVFLNLEGELPDAATDQDSVTVGNCTVTIRGGQK